MNFDEGEFFLTDNRGNTLGRLIDIKLEGGFYQGRITKIDFDQNLTNLFQLMEEYVNNQLLTYLDELDEKIIEFDLKIVPGNYQIYNVQINSNNEIAFKLEK